MGNDDVREIKSRLSIADIVGDYVALRKNGKTLWGKCPFHTEKTPSFSVSEERQTFHCFGCGKGGDVFTFIMEIENLEFKEALERLAEKAGVKLKPRGGDKNAGAKSVGCINTAAQDFFRASLDGDGGEAARAYLSRRNISREAAGRFGLGWAPPSWNALLNKLLRDGYKEKDILEAGLAVVGGKGAYDRFRGRVMFPIYNAAGRLIGFGGRALDGEGAKYLNSPESALFNKRNNLYLLNDAKQEIRKEGSAILVEGYMDAIRAHLAGFTNTVASLGTALTDTQASLIKRMTDLCYICYDSDPAGRDAALRGMYVLQKQGVSVRVVRLAGGKDPDDILSLEDGPAIFRKALGEALPLPLYHAVIKRGDLRIPEKAVSAREDLLEGLASLSPFDVAPYLDKLCRILELFPHELQREIAQRRQKIRGRDYSRPPEDGYEAGDTGGGFGADDEECRLCSMLWNSAKLRASFAAELVVPFVSDATVQNIISALLTGEEPELLEARWRQMGDARSLNLVARGNGLIDREYRGKDSMVSLTEREISNKIVDNLRRKCMRKRFATLEKKLRNETATAEELHEHLKLGRILKGGIRENEEK